MGKKNGKPGPDMAPRDGGEKVDRDEIGLEVQCASERVVEMMGELSLNQAGLSELTGIQPMTLSQIINGKKEGSLKDWACISQALKTSLDYLLLDKKAS